MNIPRLLKLRDVMLRANPDKISMGTWRCNSHACALGTFAISRQGKKDGWSFLLGVGGYPAPSFEGVEGGKAAEAYFDITYFVSVSLFLCAQEKEGEPALIEFLGKLDSLLASAGALP